MIGTNDLVSTIAGSAGTIGNANGTNSAAQFYYPAGIALDSQGNVYVADSYNSTIRRIAPSGTNWVVTTVAGQAGVYGVVDAIGTNAAFYVPSGVAADNRGDLFVSDDYSHCIRKITQAGSNWVVTTIAGQPFRSGFADGTGTNAMFHFPHGLVVDAATNVYVADMENNAIRKLTPSGTNWVVTTLAGQSSAPGSADGTGTNATFNFPAGITLDGEGNLYVVDTYHQTIRKMASVGTNWVVTTVAGRMGVTGSADGSGTNASFNYPYNAAVDTSGNLYVADTYNSTIRLGVPASSASPLLQIASTSAGQVVLSWPLAASQFVLESSGILSAGGNWSPLSNGVAIVGKTFERKDTINATNAFYRLNKP